MASTSYSATWISNLRHRRQLSLRALSRLTGIPKSSLHDLESGRHQPDQAEQAGLITRLSQFTVAEDRILGLQCIPPRPAYVNRLRHQMMDAAAQANRVLIFYPMLPPWLTASRFVRQAMELLPGTSVADYLVRHLIEPLDRDYSLIHPIARAIINKLECRQAEFASVPESTLKKQFAHFLNELIDERNIHLPIVSDDAVTQMSAGCAEATAVIVLDHEKMLRVLNTSSVEWIDAAGSNHARQLITSTLESFHCMLASADDSTGQSTLYSSYESLRFARNEEVSR